MLQVVQSGRGLAALAVAMFHLSIGLADPKYIGHPVLQEFTRRGYLGVDFFFVLSGFIIMFAHHRDIGRPDRWGAYAAKRFVRLYPIYWFYTLVLCVAVVAIHPGSSSLLPHDGATWLSTFFLVRLVNYIPPLEPAWTLFHEIAFYGVFSVLLFSKRWGIIVLVGWVASILVNFEFAPEPDRTPLKTYLSAYNLEFIVGVGAFLLWRRGNAFACRVALVLGIVTLIVTYWAQENGIEPPAYRLIYAMGFGGLLTGAVAWESRHPGFAIPFLPFLGDASYTIYLTHELFETVLVKVFMKMNTFISMTPVTIYLSVLGLTLIAGCVAYRVAEKPLLAVLRRRIAGKGPAGSGSREPEADKRRASAFVTRQL